MDLLSQTEIETILMSSVKRKCKALNWSMINYADYMIGYLGDHLLLTVTIETEDTKENLRYFVKCKPRFDEWKAKYLEDLQFFKREYVILSSLFKEFTRGLKKWCPKLYYIREDLFVFEDVSVLGYTMTNKESNCVPFTREEMMATVEAVARFHAESYKYEQRKSKELNRRYSIWEDYSDYLFEFPQGADWRDTGRNAIIAYLKVFSKYKDLFNFTNKVDTVIKKLFKDVLILMKKSDRYRNVVIHRDIWQNNVLFKTQSDGTLHALIVDYQTVLYCPGMLDLSSLLYFNTTKSFRETYLNDVLDYYLDILTEELKSDNIDISLVYEDKSVMRECYEESVLFGLTQAALIVPITSMSRAKREELFCRPENIARVNTVSRSEEFIQIAKEDTEYEFRVTELFDEIVERYILGVKGELSAEHSFKK